MPRDVTHQYEDPLDRVWLTCAQRIGLRIARTPDAFATTDGKGTLLLATDEHLDRDDCLAQMIFHELCHSLVEGPESLERPDWGLDNETGRDDVREHACLRLQASLLRPRGLRRVLGPTTDFRSFYDALPSDPFEGEDPSVTLARIARTRVTSRPWGPHVEEALDATAALARAIASFGRDDAGSLWSLVDEEAPDHPVGLPMAARDSRAASETCGSCAWAQRRGSGVRCLQAARAVKPTLPACERWEPSLDCRACGACCREAFHSVDVAPRDRVRKTHPELVTLTGDRAELLRPGGRCVALDHGESARAGGPRTGLLVESTDGSRPSARPDDQAGGTYSCRIYEDRPKSCRDFTLGSENCLLARRRVGLSR